ncbi:GNAT family N-acetyltransferase [Swingsia samuiensis]|uniref:GNAT family N-acetyltransferase n=1 Tax=Swingsia samuiensis TaxID=1293412 RepID=UPI001FE9176D|nr:GNAT family N-acetyltransferase [Swingsia samuiensis]
MAFHTMGIESAGVLAMLHRQSFPVEEVWDEQSFQSLLSIKGTESKVACVNSDPVGFVLFRTFGDETEILTIGVLPHYRRCGIGRALIRALFNKGKVILEVSFSNFSAIYMYKSLGFSIIGKRSNYYKDGSDAHVMYYGS